jgi:hypothetical protein
VASIEISLPEQDDREQFIHFAAGARDLSQVSDYGPTELSKFTAGISLLDLNVIVQKADRDPYQHHSDGCYDSAAQDP